MSYALIAHLETNGTIATLASSGSATEFRTRKLTNLLVNQQFSGSDLTVAAFRSSTSGSNPNQFDLIPGDYRIEAEILFSNLSFGGITKSKAGLYNVTDGRFEYHYGGGTDAIISTASTVDSVSISAYNNGVCLIDTQFTVSGSLKSFEIRQSVYLGISGAATSSGSAGAPSKVSSGSLPEHYAIIKILKLS